MAEYREVVKQFKRMCESNCSNCHECPIESYRGFYHCWRWVSEDPEKSEELIMKWARENPPITNNDKIKEIFGLDFKSTFTASPWTLKWLDEEYKEPEDGRSNEN